MALLHREFGEQLVSCRAEQRAIPRARVLIRPAKLMCAAGEFVAVMRDISVRGVRLKTFHRLPALDGALLALPSGDALAVELVWAKADQIGLRFAAECNIDRVIAGDGAPPPRPLRVDLNLPGRLEIAVGFLRGPAGGPLSVAIRIDNLSGQGARITSPVALAQDQPVRLSTPGMAPICAHMRWRQENRYGLAFDETFTLSEFARLAVRLQAPDLLIGRALPTG